MVINFYDFVTLFYKYSDLNFIKGLVTVLSKEQLLKEIPDFSTGKETKAW